jgi:hypothetical protein
MGSGPSTLWGLKSKLHKFILIIPGFLWHPKLLDRGLMNTPHQ